MLLNDEYLNKNAFKKLQSQVYNTMYHKCLHIYQVKWKECHFAFTLSYKHTTANNVMLLGSPIHEWTTKFNQTTIKTVNFSLLTEKEDLHCAKVVNQPATNDRAPNSPTESSSIKQVFVIFFLHLFTLSQKSTMLQGVVTTNEISSHLTSTHTRIISFLNSKSLYF